MPLSDLTNVNAVAPNSFIAMQLPSITDIRGWDTEYLIKHLQGEFPTKFIEENFRILRENRIEGIAFLALTEEKLERYGMKGGPANVIVDYIEKLKGMWHSSCFVLYFLNPSLHLIIFFR